MCLAILYHDRGDAFPLRVMETRDENVYRPHGRRAARLLANADRPSFSEHWPDVRATQGLFSCHPDPATLPAARIVGGYDLFRGTWAAVSQTNGVYAKLLIAVFDDGSFGENRTEEIRAQRAAQGYAKRGGLCLDAVAFRSAADAAERMPGLLAEALERHEKRLLPARLVVADAADAFVLHLDEHGVLRPIELPQKRLSFISIRGIDAPDSVVSQYARERLTPMPLPDPSRADGWDSWVAPASIQDNFGDDWSREGAVPYLDPDWRSHKYSVVQPPYYNAPGARFHMRATADAARAGDTVEWTTSSTCVAADRRGRFALLYDARHLAEGEPLPDTLAAARYPERTEDYTPVELANGVPLPRPAPPPARCP